MKMKLKMNKKTSMNWKATVLTVAALVTSATTLLAQDSRFSMRVAYEAGSANTFLVAGNVSPEMLTALEDARNPTYVNRAIVQARYHLTEKAYLLAGIGYMEAGFGTGKRDITMITPDPAAPSQMKGNYRYQYLEIPVGFGYRFFSRNKFSIGAEAAVSCNIALANKLIVKSYYNDKTERKEFDVNMQNNILAAAISVPFTYQYSEKIGFEAAPRYMSSFTPTYKGREISEYAQTIGLQVGALYRF